MARITRIKAKKERENKEGLQAERLQPTFFLERMLSEETE
jgi:hypothetical protein